MAFHRVTWNLQPQMIAAYRKDLPPTRGPVPSTVHAIGLRMWRDDHEGTAYLVNDADGQDMVMQHGVGSCEALKATLMLGKYRGKTK